ncbi:MAG: ABC transporter permease subunit [Phycisphaera sp.]|nr:ABC transporter permease subunit [Phycisphaera sp.]
MTQLTTTGLDASVRSGLWLSTRTLWQREMVRFFRQRNRVIGALATPIVFWLLLGGGLNRSFTVSNAASTSTGGIGYLEYFFPGTVVLILLFTAIFSTISVIEDRREGFLQGVLVSPMPRLALVLGKVFGGATIATVQGLLFLAVWPWVGHVHWDGTEVLWLLGALPVMFVLSCALTGLGLCIAWPMDSTAGFHAVMNLFLMPMWFLSGAVFPYTQAPSVMRWIMLCNPLTYGQTAFASTLGGGRVHSPSPLGPIPSMGVTLLFAVGTVTFGHALVNRRRRDGSS